MSKVFVIRGKGVLLSNGQVDKNKMDRMFSRGFANLSDNNDPVESSRFFFKKDERIGIKINTIGGGKLSTRPEVSFSLANTIAGSGVGKENIIVWDRTNRELRNAGYRLNRNSGSFRVFGTDTQGAGYDRELFSHYSIGSLLSSIQSNLVSVSISLAILKDHGLAGITAGMKNYFGAIHNPNKYHDFNCNPFVAELFHSPLIRNKHRLSIIDGLLIQYHRGPSYHSQWAEKYESLIFSTDPVAADTVGWSIIEKLRAKKGLPSLKEEKREPGYLKTAEKMGLGKATIKSINIIEEEV